MVLNGRMANNLILGRIIIGKYRRLVQFRVLHLVLLTQISQWGKRLIFRLTPTMTPRARKCQRRNVVFGAG